MALLGRAGRFARLITKRVSAAMWSVFGALLLAAFVLPNIAHAQQFPALSGRVVDAANVIPPDVEARLNQKLTALETQSQRQLVVATIPSLEGYEISDYGYRLGRAWGLGDKERNDGAVLIVAPADRKLRIEVGYGLEPVLTDGLSSLIINQTIVPRFKAQDMPGGIEAGVDAIIAQLTLPADEAQKIAAAAAKPRQAESGFPLGGLFFIAILFLFVLLPLFRRMRGGRRRRGHDLDDGIIAPIIIWDVLNSVAGAALDGDSGGGGDWGGGGGFSGGGGSFGGGGASGSW